MTRTSGNSSLAKTIKRHVFPHAPSPITTNFRAIVAIFASGGYTPGQSLSHKAHLTRHCKQIGKGVAKKTNSQKKWCLPKTGSIRVARVPRLGSFFPLVRWTMYVCSFACRGC